MIHRETLDFVQGKENPHQERLVLVLQRQCESVDNGTQNFQQFRDTIVSLCFIDELEEHIVDASPNRGTQV